VVRSDKASQFPGQGGPSELSSHRVHFGASLRHQTTTILSPLKNLIVSGDLDPQDHVLQCCASSRKCQAARRAVYLFLKEAVPIGDKYSFKRRIVSLALQCYPAISLSPTKSER
jgi:hypothetical protein